jgi:hypothetical protein
MSFTPANEGKVFGWCVFLVVTIVSACNVANSFQVIQKTHLYPGCIACSSPLQHITDAQVHVQKLLELGVHRT